MTANYRTRLIGIAHRHFLNIPDIAWFLEAGHIRFRSKTLKKVRPIGLMISSNDGSIIFAKGWMR
jgi:hypothetical protein